MPVSESSVAGALVGCAVGDAMGAPFEGLWSHSLPSADSLVAGFHEYHGFPRGQYTDDTQLTIATVESLVESGDVEPADIARRIAELWRHHDIIGPGGACTHAAEHFLATGDWQSMGAPDGQAGNGTAMRTAVLGLLYVDLPDRLPGEVATISRLTHTDSRSVAGGVAIAAAGRLLAIDPFPNTNKFCESVASTTAPFNAELAECITTLAGQWQSDSVMNFVASAGQESPEFAQPIITPFVIPTVLAALYSIIRCPESWESAVTHAVRLGGDVDTLGAIVGALAGIRHGYEAIPEHLSRDVQDSEALRVLAARYHETIRRRFTGN